MLVGRYGPQPPIFPAILLLTVSYYLFNDVCRDFTRPDLPSGEQADVCASATGPGSAATGVPDLTTAIASKMFVEYLLCMRKPVTVYVLI